MVSVVFGAKTGAAAVRRVEEGRGTVLRVVRKVVGRVQIAAETVAMLRVVEVVLVGVT